MALSTSNVVTQPQIGQSKIPVGTGAAGNALNSAINSQSIAPSWLSTLNSVQSAYKAPTTPSTVGLGQSSIPTPTTGTPGLVALPVSGSNTSFTVGGKTYTDAPGGQSQTVSSATPTPTASPIQTTTPTPTPAPTSLNTQNVQSLTNTGAGQNNNPTVQTANTGLLANNQAAQDIANNYGQQIAQVGQQGANAQAGYLTTGTSPVALGNAGIINQNTSARETALANAGNFALSGITTGTNALSSAASSGNTQQGQNISAAGTAGQLSSPISQFGVQINPQTGQPIGGGSATSAAVNGGIIGANQTSAGNFQTQINNIGATLPPALSAFDIASSYAQKVGGGNVPILQGLQKLAGTTVNGNQDVSGFQAELQALRNAWDSIEGGGSATAIPDNITGDQLNQQKATLQADAQNKLTGYKNQLTQLQTGGQSNGSSNDPLGIL